MSDSWQAIDVNSRGSLTAVSSVDDRTIVRLTADPITGALLVSSSASLTAAWFNETPTGVIDGVNKVFTLANAPANNSLVLTIDRQPQILTTDYTISGSTITYVSAPDSSLSGTPHNAIYATTGTVSGVVYTQTPVGAIDGANKAYTTTNTISTVIGIWFNGEYIDPSQYTVSGSGFTMGTALPAALSGLPFTIVYV